MKRHYEEIDILKGIAILLVILGHSIILYPVNLHEVDWCRKIYEIVRLSHMPIFFIVSGYCWNYGIKGYRRYITKKAYRVLVPYLVFSLIDLLPRAFLAAFVNKSRSIGESISSIVFNGGAYWFLYSLFMIFVVFPLIARFMQKSNPFKWLAVFICFCLKFVPGLPEVFLIRRTVYHLLYFVIGFSLQDVVDLDKCNSWWKKRKMFGWMVIVSVSVFTFFVSSSYYEMNETQVLGIPLAFAGTLAAYVFSNILNLKMLRYLLSDFGKYSLQLYLLNGFTLTISRTISVTVLHISSPAIIILINLLIDLLGAYLFIKYVMSRIKVIRIISGM